MIEWTCLLYKIRSSQWPIKLFGVTFRFWIWIGRSSSIRRCLAVKKQEFPGMTMGILPHNDGEVGGCLFKSADDQPSDQGLMIYLNGNGRLDEAIAAVV